jgi:membrane protein required for colicin V production
VNWLDIVLVVLIGLATFIGLRKGIIKMALTLGGLVLGIFLAGRYYTSFSEHLTLISSPTWAKVAAFAIIFIGIMAAAAIVAHFLEKAASAIMLGWANRLVGAVLGFLVGAMFCGAVLAIWVKYLGVSGAITDSNIAPILLDHFPKVLALLPDEFDGIRAFFD